MKIKFQKTSNMELKDMQSLGLTPDDIDVLIEGLDVLPEKGLASELMTLLFK